MLATAALLAPSTAVIAQSQPAPQPASTPAPKPAEPGKVLMPDLVGKPEKEAVETLQKAGLKVTVRYFSNPRLRAPGRVLAQSVAAGTQTAGPVVLTVGGR